VGARHLGRLIARFASVGAVCTALNLAIMFVGTELAGLPYLVAALLTCAITIPTSYFLHREFTFQTDGQRTGEQQRFWRFVATQLLQFSGGLAFLALLVEVLGLRPMWAMVAVSATMFIYGFVTTSTWVFRAFGSRQP
jgi:putative flippase GtrA